MSQQPVPVAHPSLALHVTEVQRDRALTYLQGAFADGRLTAAELDERVGQALVATTRADLNAAFSGLVRIPISSQAVGAHPAYAPVLNRNPDGRTGRASATVAHWSSLITLGFGPAIMYAVTQKDTYANVEAAKAFNFNVVMGAVMLALSTVLAWLPGHEAIAWIVGVTWVVLTVVGGLRASNGEDWVNPVQKVVPLRVLEDRPKSRRRPRS